MEHRNGLTSTPIRRFSPEGRTASGLLDLRLDSYRAFIEEGISQLVHDMEEIVCETPWRCVISLDSAVVDEPERSATDCLHAGITYDTQVHASASLKTLDTEEIVEQRIRLCRIPLMDDNGGMVINGVRKVVINQVVRAPGAGFTSEYDPVSGKVFGKGRISPERGVWIAFEVNDGGLLRCRLNGRTSLSALAILRLFGLRSDREIIEAFEGVLSGREATNILLATLDAGDCRSWEEALFQVYADIAPGAPPNLDSALERVERLLFRNGTYSLSAEGRHMLNRKFGSEEGSDLLTVEDIVRVVAMVIEITTGAAEPDDIDHLANRRVRGPGELVRREFDAGLHEVARATVGKLELAVEGPRRPLDALVLSPLQKRISGFFSASKLCQVLDNVNPLSELTHMRRVSSLGPGGLNRQNAGVEPRDVHHSFYGKVCPIETPEGQNIGLLSTLATEACVDEHGLLTTPVRRIMHAVGVDDADALGREVLSDVEVGGLTLARRGETVSTEMLEALRRMGVESVPVRAFVRGDDAGIVFVNAYEEEGIMVAQYDVALDSLGQIRDESVVARRGADRVAVSTEQVDYIDLTPRQVVSASTALIPFLEHDDANRALMGCNMQRQAVPLAMPQAALVTTGMEREIARASGYQVVAEEDGVVLSSTPRSIELLTEKGERRVIALRRLERSNGFTLLGQRTAVERFQRVRKGDLLAEGPACSEGELALGQRVLVAYMSWGGYNYEDAIIVSEKVVRAGKFRSFTAKRFTLDALETQLGNEQITSKVPDVAAWRKRALSEDGVVKVGTFVKAGQILVGKASPRPAPAEAWDELVLKAFAGGRGTEDSTRFRNSSLELPKGQDGRVIGVKVIRKDDETAEARGLPSGCHTRVEVEILGERILQPGDKMSGRHGNKGCVSIVVPEADMPFLPDGTPVDIILSPLGVPSRMNLGQLMEVHLGWAAHRMGFRALTSVFESATWGDVEQCLAQAWLVEHAGGLRREELPEDDLCSVDWEVVKAWVEENGLDFEAIFGDAAHKGTEAGRMCLEIWLKKHGIEEFEGATFQQLRQQALRIDREQAVSAPIMGKQVLRDGRTGERIDRPVAVGYKYMLKLVHMVQDKMHARSTGTYSMITQQPLGGKGVGGGQRLGEMEVWGLEAYSAAHVLWEMLTVKSDDMEGRNEVAKAIMADREFIDSSATRVEAGLPSSFELLLLELKSLGLNPELIREDTEAMESIHDDAF